MCVGGGMGGGVWGERVGVCVCGVCGGVCVCVCVFFFFLSFCAHNSIIPYRCKQKTVSFYQCFARKKKKNKNKNKNKKQILIQFLVQRVDSLLKEQSYTRMNRNTLYNMHRINQCALNGN